MKTLPLYLAAVAALTACSSDEVINPGGDIGDDEIVFHSAVSATRGSDTDASALAANGFWVRAVNAKTGEDVWGKQLKFTSKDGGTTFSAELGADDANIDLRWRNRTLNFYASNLDPQTYTLSSDQKYTINPPADITKHVDFVYATNTGSRSDFESGQVPLNFSHALCQIEVQAKNTNPAYIVKVKGYAINYANLSNTFTFPTPVKCATTAEAQASTNFGSWGTHTIASSTENYRIFNSGYKNGFTTADGIFDSADNCYLLNADEYTTIKGEGDDGLACIYPCGTFSGYAQLNSGVWQGGYIALLVQIDYAAAIDNPTDSKIGQHQSPLYPACQSPTESNKNTLSTRVAYSGLPKYYGWIYKPYTFLNTDWNNYVGKKVTFQIDFGAGLGTVGYFGSTPVNATASTYDPATGTDSATGTVTDPFADHTAVLGADITVSTTVTDVTDLTTVNL